MAQVFVLCTGRCGSTTFAKAAAHATNFTAAHESLTHCIGPARFAYKDQHIEIDNRLSWMLARLDRAVGDAPYYIHLLRDPDAVAASFVGRKDRGIMKAYREDILMRHVRKSPNTPVHDAALDMIDTVTANIRAFLRDKTKVMTVQVETIAEDFPRIWDWIGAEGSLAAAMAEWQVRYNATVPPQQG